MLAVLGVLAVLPVLPGVDEDALPPVLAVPDVATTRAGLKPLGAELGIVLLSTWTTGSV